jgi:hypothetical protein
MEVRHRSAENRERVDFNTAKMGALHSLARAVNPHGYPTTPKTWFFTRSQPACYVEFFSEFDKCPLCAVRLPR